MADAVPSTSRRRLFRPRLHCSTWVWLAVALALLVIAEVPGSMMQPVWNWHKIEHGWPFTYAIRENDEGWPAAFCGRCIAISSTSLPDRGELKALGWASTVGAICWCWLWVQERLESEGWNWRLST